MSQETGMLVTIETVLAECDVTRGELIAWIEQRWVLPVDRDGTYFFNDADRARIQLISELRRDLAINDEAMPVVLQLLDQIYALRRAMGNVKHAIARLPEETRAELEQHLLWEDDD